jgi:hypothetical protein
MSANLTNWLENCEMVVKGTNSILQYLDEEANDQLIRLLTNTTWNASQWVQDEAERITKSATQYLKFDFIVGLQNNYDTSMLLFEKTTGLLRSDMLIHQQSGFHADSRTGASADHKYKSKEAQMARKAWGIGTSVGKEIEARLERGVHHYYRVLYELGEKIHQQQVKKFLGNADEVAQEVELYKNQSASFDKCYRKKIQLSGPGNPCLIRGLSFAALARAQCTANLNLTNSGTLNES